MDLGVFIFKITFLDTENLGSLLIISLYHLNLALKIAY